MRQDPQDPHFDVPEELSRPERARDALITAVLWAVYLYLWIPLVSMLAWALGFEFAYEVMVRAGGAADLLPIMLSYLVVVASIFSAFTLWSISNRLRFQNLNRRTRRDRVPDQALADYYKIPLAQIHAMRIHQIMRVGVDADGVPELLSIESNDTEPEAWKIADGVEPASAAKTAT